ncbi:MAG: TRAP transporter TatT component family protein [Bacteroidia bacterium]|nr:TRAP transporter TatT component family protein [Bacteroidia bacterium]MDW8133914.1 TRAP transporter TatT component family protein [Bacteroidia bacterium]
MTTKWIVTVVGALGWVLLQAQSDNLEVLWSQRDNPEKAQEAIRLLEMQLKDNPHQPDKVVRLARLYYLWGEQTDEKSLRLERYNKAFKACRAELAHQLGLSEKAKDEEIVKRASKEHLPLLYWAAAALGRWAKHAPFTQKVQARSVVRMFWDRVMELHPEYFFGGAYRFFGGYYALVPAITGEQDVNKSREMFEKSLAAGPEYLETRVLYAEAYAAHPKVRNLELFRKLLQEVLQANPEVNPECAAENRLAQRKAQKLLAQETELFE